MPKIRSTISPRQPKIVRTIRRIDKAASSAGVLVDTRSEYGYSAAFMMRTWARALRLVVRFACTFPVRAFTTLYLPPPTATTR